MVARILLFEQFVIIFADLVKMVLSLILASIRKEKLGRQKYLGSIVLFLLLLCLLVPLVVACVLANPSLVVAVWLPVRYFPLGHPLYSSFLGTIAQDLLRYSFSFP